MKIMVIDGQGGKIGKMLVENFKKALPEYELIALGTNSIATSTMLKAGADLGATGENPVILNCTDADIIIGPLGIAIANSLLGEITPSMSAAINKSKAKKVLIPVNRCNTIVVGVTELPLNEYVKLAIREVERIVRGQACESLNTN